MTYVIETSDLGVQLAQSTILHPISLTVKKGENVGIIQCQGIKILNNALLKN